MTVYLNPKLVETSFQRLAPVANTGKKHLERTSALMYFLAFSAAAKKFDRCPLDLDPETIDGKNNRDAISLEFVKCVTLKATSGRKIRQVFALGNTKLGGPEPEKRISSNFFTVPVKKASESLTVYNYPKRPRAPLLKLGAAATNLKWGIDYHDSWANNLPNFFSDMKGNTPLTDLGVFIFRDTQLPIGHVNVQDALSNGIYDRFGKDLAEFWSSRMGKEKSFFRHGNDPFRNSYQDTLAESAFSAVDGVSDREALLPLDKNVLIDKVIYLEGLLAAYYIEY